MALTLISNFSSTSLSVPSGIGGGSVAGNSTLTVAYGFQTVANAFISASATNYGLATVFSNPLSGQLNNLSHIAAFSATLGNLELINPSSGGFAVTLPQITINGGGQFIVLKNITASTNAITLTPNGIQTIDGTTSFVMNLSFQTVTLYSDGVSNWSII